MTPGWADASQVRGTTNVTMVEPMNRPDPAQGQAPGRQASPQPAQQAVVNTHGHKGRRPSRATEDQDSPPAPQERSGRAAPLTSPSPANSRSRCPAAPAPRSRRSSAPPGTHCRSPGQLNASEWDIRRQPCDPVGREDPLQPSTSDGLTAAAAVNAHHLPSPSGLGGGVRRGEPASEPRGAHCRGRSLRWIRWERRALYEEASRLAAPAAPGAADATSTTRH